MGKNASPLGPRERGGILFYRAARSQRGHSAVNISLSNLSAVKIFGYVPSAELNFPQKIDNKYSNLIGLFRALNQVITHRSDHAI